MEDFLMNKQERSLTLGTEPESFDSGEGRSGSSSSSSSSKSTTLLPPEPRPVVVGRQQQDWWQKSIVRRSEEPVRQMVRDIIQDDSSSLLQQEPPSNDIAVFHRKEIITGERLGSGGFSHVFEITGFRLDPAISAKCTEQQQELRNWYKINHANGLALKHLQKKLVRKPEVYRRSLVDLVLEGAYLSRLDHPNVIRLRGLPVGDISALANGSYDGYFIITDRLQGTLADCIHDWKNNVAEEPTILEKTDYALQMARALEYLHSKKIIYRDLKPHNVGLTSDGTVQLFDFGLCRELPNDGNNNDHDDDDDNTAASEKNDQVFEMSGVGTRRYMACEIINTHQYNRKADVYSWAMVTWETMSLCKPYSMYSINDHRRKVCQEGERPPIYSSWPSYLETVLKHSWCENVADRLTMSDVVDYLTTQLYMPETEVVVQHPMSPVGVQDFVDVTAAPCYPTGIELPLLPDDTQSYDDDDDGHRFLLLPRIERSQSYSSTRRYFEFTFSLEDGGVEVCANDEHATKLPPMLPPRVDLAEAFRSI